MTGRPFDAVLVVAFGGPEGMGDVRPFLANVLRGRRVAPERVEEVAKHYEHFGGVSPLAAITRRQVEGLKSAPGRPRTGRARVPRHAQLASAPARHAQDDGAGRRQARDRLRVCARTDPIRAARSTERTSSSARQAAVEAGLSDVSVTYVGDWHHHDRFIEANARHVRAALDTLPAPVRSAARLVFTAHSIPVAMAGAARYRAQLLESSRLVAERLGVADWALVFQSRSGRPEDPWLEPDVCSYLRAERASRARRRRDLSDRLRLRSRRGALRPGHRSGSGLPRRGLADGAGRHGERRSAVSRDDGRRGREDVGSLSDRQAVGPVGGERRTDCRRSGEMAASLNAGIVWSLTPSKPVSDRTTLRSLTQFPRRSIYARPQSVEYKRHRGTLGFEGAFCDNQIRAARKSLILNGEMSEWSIEHAWKACVREIVPRVRIPFSPPFLDLRSRSWRRQRIQWRIEGFRPSLAASNPFLSANQPALASADRAPGITASDRQSSGDR